MSELEKVYIVYVEHEKLEMPVMEVYDRLSAAESNLEELKEDFPSYDRADVKERVVYTR